MATDFEALTRETVRRWSGVEMPNEAARRAVADMEALIVELERVRHGLEFEDEPSSFEAALQAEKERPA
jgi:hypothetical protein